MTMGGTAGGAAGAGGYSFQDSVAAWAAVHVLAEQAASPRWSLDADTYFIEIRCETGSPVDDLTIITSAAGAVYLQCKKSIQLSSRQGSELASTINQFVKHFIAQRSTVGGANPWDRQLDLDRDRLVLMTDGNAPAWVKRDAPELLDRFRRDKSYNSILDAAKNSEETKIAVTLDSHARTAWKCACGLSPSDAELRELFSLIRFDILDLRVSHLDGNDDLNAMDKLRQAVLALPTEANCAYDLLKSYCRNLVTTRSGSARAELQRTLIGHGIAVRAAIGMQPDLDRLRDRTQDTLQHLVELSVIEMDGQRIKIDRPAVTALVDAVRHDSGHCLIVGEPGAGKSGVLHDAVTVMMRSGWDVVFLAADLLAADSPGALKQELGTKLGLKVLLERWEGSNPGVLVVDALDAARAEHAARVLKDLVRQVVQLRSRWRVVASIRKFDLRCSADWQDLFRGTPISDNFLDAEFQRVRHLNVPPLDEAELAQIELQAPKLNALIESTRNEPLFDLLRQPFNLRLGAALLSDGLKISDLTPLRTQVELLERYWERRVLGEGVQRLTRQAVVRSICEKMVIGQRLRLPQSQIVLPENSVTIQQLMSQGVLSQSPLLPGSSPNSDSIAFSHHVLFDYAIARTLLTDGPVDLSRRLGAKGLVLLIRPSVSLHFQHLWLQDDGRITFWREALALLGDVNVPRVGQIVGPEVAVKSAQRVADFKPVLDKLQSPIDGDRGQAEMAISHVIGALLATGQDFAGDAGGPWTEFLEQLSLRITANTVSSVLSLLGFWMDKISRMTSDQRRATGVAGRQLLRFAESQPRYRNAIYFPGIAVTCRTFDTNPAESLLVIEALLSPGELNAERVEAFVRLAHEVKSLIVKTPDLAERVYARASAHFLVDGQDLTESGRNPEEGFDLRPSVRADGREERQTLWFQSRPQITENPRIRPCS